jgi:hypothetical protein
MRRLPEHGHRNAGFSVLGGRFFRAEMHALPVLVRGSFRHHADPDFLRAAGCGFRPARRDQQGQRICNHEVAYSNSTRPLIETRCRLKLNHHSADSLAQNRAGRQPGDDRPFDG